MAMRVGVVGLGRKGADLTANLPGVAGVRVVAGCDVDPRELPRQVGLLDAAGVQVFSATDAKRLIDPADVDAVVIATPSHWHALQTVWACEAGKDVYVEKPVSHTVWEGQQMVRAAARHGRIVQAGNQMRSDTAMPEIIEYLRAGPDGSPRAR